MVGKIVPPQELIGKEIQIIAARNSSHLGLHGIIVDETKATIKVRVQGIIKTVLKHAITFKILSTNEVIEGKDITKRPEDRIKGK